MRHEHLSIDGRPAVHVELSHDVGDGRWMTGLIPLTALNVERGNHGMVIEGGKRDGWGAVARHSMVTVSGSPSRSSSQR
jgi:hypothetical protein